MIGSEGKKVVFRLSDIWFSLAVDALLEIRETDGVEIDKSAADLNRGLIGQILFRDSAVPLWDVRLLLGLPSADDDNVLVFVFGSDGVWAFLIETVVGVFFHNSNLDGVSFEELQEGQRVSFTEGCGEKGPRAENVQLV